MEFPSQNSPSTTTEKPVLDAKQTTDVQLALGRTAEQQHQWPVAMTIYRQLLDANPKHFDATHRLAILYDRQGDSEQSAQWFQNALKLKPGDPDLHCDIGYSLYAKGRYVEAEQHLRRAIAAAPDHSRAQNHLGLVLAQKGEREAALAAFRRAHCTPAQAHANLALILALNNHTQEARQHLQTARSLKAEDRDIQNRLEELEALIAQRESQPTRPLASGDGPLTRPTLPREVATREGSPRTDRPIASDPSSGFLIPAGSSHVGEPDSHPVDTASVGSASTR